MKPLLKKELYIKVIKEGKKTFGSNKQFTLWLNSENYFFDNKKPKAFLKTKEGLNFIYSTLIGMQYGDNA